ncbi:hypothetical protein [Rheinheimera sp. MM224]|uniref:hypothetical protein n=1 Tax=Rheinheimera sp. MM224 TaxID=3019969 RepID=UPI0021F8F71C|nr:hypothetical protein [Rheinheimera sp. MM224]CAI3806074.1 hypothetical protein JAMGFMIE_04060 [Rheinheimera sp. MM224]
MQKSLFILLFGLMLAFPCAAVQKFIWLTDSSIHQNPKQYRQALDVNGLTLKLLMQGVTAFQADPVQTTTDRAMAMLKTEASACAGNRIKNTERLTFSYATAIPHTVFPGLRLYSKTSSKTTQYLQQQLNGQQKISLQKLLKGDNELHFAVGGGRSYGDQLDTLFKQPQWQHKFWQRRSIDMSAGLIDMLVQDRVDLLIEYPNVMQHYLAQYSQSTELTSFSIEEAEPYMLGYILCAKTQEGQQLTQFFQQRLKQVSQQRSYLDAHLGWVDTADRVQLTQLYNQVFGTSF